MLFRKKMVMFNGVVNVFIPGKRDGCIQLNTLTGKKANKYGLLFTDCTCVQSYFLYLSNCLITFFLGFIFYTIFELLSPFLWGLKSSVKTYPHFNRTFLINK